MTVADIGKVGKEIRQTRPFRSSGAEATISLLRTADLIRRRLSAVIEPAGITFQQYNVLRILRGAGPDGVPTLEIADRMIEKAPGITRLIDRLEAKGLVERRRCTEDRRVVYGTISAAGLDLLASLDPQVDATDESAMENLNDEEQRTLIGLLDTLRDP